MKIPTILKGDDAGAITLALDSSHSYDGATLVVAYQGATKTFTGLAAGGTVSLVYNHVETAAFRLGCYPMEARLIGAGGSVETVSNAEWRIKVTDIVSEVNCGGSFAVVPGAASVPVTDIEELGGRYKLADVAAKLDEVCRILAQRTAPVSGPSAGPFGAVALVLLFSLGAFAANVQTARLDDMYNDERVVTNVSFEGLATPGAVSNIVTKAYIEDLGITADFSTNNAALVETIEATAPAPGNYANVSNRAMNAVQTEADPTVPSWAKKTVGDFYSYNLYSLVNRDFYAKDSSIKSQSSIWLKGSSNPTVTVGRDKLSDNTYPYARQTVLGFSAYEGFDYYAHYRPRGIYIWPWWNEDAANVIAYLFPTNGNGGTFALTSDIPSVPTAQINAAATTNALQDAELESHASQLSQLSQSLDGKVPTSRTINGKALTSNISLSADEVGATTPEDVTAAIREQSLGGIWDETLQVWWTPRMRNGSLTYEATTNVNLNAEN